MKNFYDKEDYTFDDIKLLIENEVEESIYLDFKSAGSLEKTDSKRKEISKDVAAFANSEGGIIIYGIQEADHKANTFSFINGNEYTKEWLEQTIQSGIQRHIEGLLIIPIRLNGNILETIYLLKIPKSLDAPHISKDKRFYKRYNFESVAMEEYEIRHLYGRKMRSKLFIHSWVTSVEKEDDSTMKVLFEVKITNDGQTSETFYKTNVYIENYNSFLKITCERGNNYDYTWLDENRCKVSANGVVPIFPEETVTSIRFNIEFPKDKLKEALADLELEVKLFYSGGEDQLNGTLIDFIEMIQKTPLS